MEKKTGGISKETTVLRRSFPLTPNTPRLTKKHHGPTPKPAPPEFFTPRVGSLGWHPRRSTPLPNPGQLSATRSPARAFREGEGYDFVLFIANHRLPSRRGGGGGRLGWLHLHGVAFQSRAAAAHTFCKTSGTFLHASTRCRAHRRALGGFERGSARELALPQPALLNKAKPSKSQGVFCSQQRPAGYF